MHFINWLHSPILLCHWFRKFSLPDSLSECSDRIHGVLCTISPSTVCHLPYRRDIGVVRSRLDVSPPKIARVRLWVLYLHSMKLRKRKQNSNKILFNWAIWSIILCMNIVWVINIICTLTAGAIELWCWSNTIYAFVPWNALHWKLERFGRNFSLFWQLSSRTKTNKF